MKSLKYLLMAFIMLSITACEAQIQNAKKQTVKISGNCEMCKKTIENAGNIKKIAKVNWNKDTKEAEITFNSKKTNIDAVLKRIAIAGYDNEKYLASAESYAKLPECCQYEREKREVVVNTKNDNHNEHETHANTASAKETTIQKNQLQPIFDVYFKIKDALVATNGSLTSESAKAMTKLISEVKMEELSTEEHNVWMKVMNELKEDAQHISETKDTGHQRDHFTTLSKRIYELLKVSKKSSSTYLMFCPMFNNGKGANWLSKEEEIKNPYYGNKMLSCGSVQEIIK
ncbi:DUF3347 domain-containing protein [Flavobacterium sp. H122]|uniref:DUF3347 domain-containing protein n=1 Tax=Flavobacterium sp. H122 TaxID=2529860 RepID=UPI0010A99BF0|nr:DUF3347 domain-containing protein [Flavobacterium sp. H122]